jgi:hypothetical protein
MLRNTRRAGLFACAILLAACASQTTQQSQNTDEEQIVVTGQRRDPQVHDSVQAVTPVPAPELRAPPAPPPTLSSPMPVAPADGRARAAIGGVVGGNYASRRPNRCPATSIAIVMRT